MSDSNHIIFCSSSYWEYDRRMQRIIKTLTDSGFKSKWLSRTYDNTAKANFEVSNISINCFFKKGIAFYLELNHRVFWTLRHHKGTISAVDLDTLFAAALAAMVFRRRLYFDAHELFYEVPELEGKPFKQFIWRSVAKWCLPKVFRCYTVNNALKHEYEKRFSEPFAVIRNVPEETTFLPEVKHNRKSLVYLGAVNKGRGVSLAIKALQNLSEYTLTIIGEGDESSNVRQLIDQLQLQDRVIFKGWVKPDVLFDELKQHSIGLNLLYPKSENYRLSLANKFFDYMHAGLPSVNMRFPEYENILKSHEVGLMIDDYSSHDLEKAVRALESDKLYLQLFEACKQFKDLYHWRIESQKLIALYKEGE